MLTPEKSRIRRRAARVAVGASILGVIIPMFLAAPAGASVPEDWSNPDSVDPLQAIALLVGGPLLLIVLITLAVYLPALARGEKVAPGAPDSEWFGGPRKSNDELAAPDGEASQAGGASARW